MQRIPVVLAKAGMVLARDVMSPGQSDGIPICGRGLSLTEGMIERLSRMGVESVCVAGHPLVLEGESSLEDLLGALDRRFERVQGDPLTLKIRDLYRNHLQKAWGDRLES